MPSTYKTPGVYVEEISKLPPSVAQVETAIPAFIGYTESNTYNGQSLLNVPVRIKSLVEYEAIFGGAFEETFSATVELVGGVAAITTPPAEPSLVYRMYYGLQLYFANGGGPCYIVSAGTYAAIPAVSDTDLAAGLAAVRKEDEPTILIFPDATAIPDPADFYTLYQLALQQCGELKDRVCIIDVYDGDSDYTQAGGPDVINDDPDGFRERIGTNYLSYGSAYYPWLRTTLSFAYDEASVTIAGGIATVLRDDDNEANSLYHQDNGAYHQVVSAINSFGVLLPPSPIMAGIYAMVDSTRGVWKAPANVSLTGIDELTVNLDDQDQGDLNVHSSGKSINAIRKFTGKGILVWGARTLAGNDNEWRYISVRRFFNMVEESVKKASEPFVFEPNDANTWVKVRAMIENFLLLQWRAGALAGAKPEDAFYVRVGLPETMTAQDILEGRMIVEIGMAVVRPAEFIILKFSHKMAEA